MSILALNSGSTSLKFGLFDDAACEPFLTGEIDWAQGDRDQARLIVRPARGSMRQSRVPVQNASAAAACALRTVLACSEDSPVAHDGITLVGHRVVHGGIHFRSSIVIDPVVKAAIRALCDLAPLHNPPALETILAAEAALPGIAQVAVFDTAFYSRLPRKACVLPLPYEWHESRGIRRYGFHGTSHAYCAARAAEMLGKPPAELSLVSCHLGGGCSATAIQGGVAIATTMGFSPLGGLMMGTRCGSIDPGILLHLQRDQSLTMAEVDDALNYFSGLLGVSGISADLGRIEEAAAQGNDRAQLAFEMFADQVRSSIAGLAVTLGRIDVVSFTDRIGERSSALRAAVADGLGILGVHIDPERNASAQADTDIAPADSPVRVLVLRTQEELMVAREAARVMAG